MHLPHRPCPLLPQLWVLEGKDPAALLEELRDLRRKQVDLKDADTILSTVHKAKVSFRGLCTGGERGGERGGRGGAGGAVYVVGAGGGGGGAAAACLPVCACGWMIGMQGGR